MNDGRELESILKQFKAGKLTLEQIRKHLESSQFDDLGFAKVDHSRAARTGVPEVIFAEGKSAAQIAAIARKMIQRGSGLLITRFDQAKYNTVKRSLPRLKYFPDARCATLGKSGKLRPSGILVVTAGTSDIAVAEEAAVTCEALGYAVDRVYDAGVAGIHRLLAHSRQLRAAHVVIVVAGMEGALPSVVGGLVKVPVIAVPTSIGYGASFGGVAALLAMLNSCASGVTVVNIDNGFGAAIAAIRIISASQSLK